MPYSPLSNVCLFFKLLFRLTYPLWYRYLVSCRLAVVPYLPPPHADGAQAGPNRWVQFFTSAENRHALPLFTSLLNLVCAYDPVGIGGGWGGVVTGGGTGLVCGLE